MTRPDPLLLIVAAIAGAFLAGASRRAAPVVVSQGEKLIGGHDASLCTYPMACRWPECPCQVGPALQLTAPEEAGP